MKIFMLSTFARGLFAAFIAVVVFFSADSAFATINDDSSLIEGAKLCTQYLPRHERQYGIPEQLLAAIASTESGRYNKTLGINLPWPWTINVEGKGYFFDTKEQAVAAVHNLQARGYQSIDVGCMQVNLHHHPQAFSSLEQAFDPAYNIAYAAQFLKQNFTDEGSWRKAAADYHSHTPMFGEQYARLVFNAWGRIINKVAEARANHPILQAETVNSPTVLYPDKNVVKVADASNTAHHKTRPKYESMHMYSISVSHDTTKENGVLVIRPDNSEPVQQQAELEDQFVSNSVKAAEASAHDSKSNGAQVIKVGGADTTNSKGQFDPHSHIIHVSADSASGKASTPTSAPNSAFVFDN